jgi:hypothetical protein
VIGENKGKQIKRGSRPAACWGCSCRAGLAATANAEPNGELRRRTEPGMAPAERPRASGIIVLLGGGRSVQVRLGWAERRYRQHTVTADSVQGKDTTVSLRVL